MVSKPWDCIILVHCLVSVEDPHVCLANTIFRRAQYIELVLSIIVLYTYACTRKQHILLLERLSLRI